MSNRTYGWGTYVSVNGKKAIYVGENIHFSDPDIDGKHLVILEGTDEIVECNNIRFYSSKRTKGDDLKWGDHVEVWDDEIDKEHPLKGIFLKKYDYRDQDGDLLYVIIPENFSEVPSEGYLNCRKILHG